MYASLKGQKKEKVSWSPSFPQYIYPLLLPPVHHLDQHVRGWWVNFCIFENPKRGQDSKPPLPLAVNTWNIQLSKLLKFKDRHYTGIYPYILTIQLSRTQYIFTWVHSFTNSETENKEKSSTIHSNHYQHSCSLEVSYFVLL